MTYISTFLHAAVYKFTWYATEKIPGWMGITPHIYVISNMDLIITKRDAM